MIEGSDEASSEAWRECDDDESLAIKGGGSSNESMLAGGGVVALLLPIGLRMNLHNQR
jgi:hypothetical protein